MPRFQIHPVGQPEALSEVIAGDAAGILYMVERLKCKEADVLCDDVYAFSVRLGGNGLWCIFQRGPDSGAEVVPLFG